MAGSVYKYRTATYNSSVENTDRDDIQAVLNGDTAAFERLVLRYQRQITRLMWRFSRDSFVCQRLVQDTFVEAFISLKTYKAKAPFLHWLKKIGTRTGYRYWKERDKQKQFLSLEDFDFAQKDKDRDIAPEKAANILHTLLDRLPITDKLVLTLMYFEDCSVKEIAQRMGWTAAAVKMRALRARKKIKKIAEKENLLEKLEWIR
ncbi:MAG: RNA polymerase sigma factor [Sedimentisphaerales bacterium]|nr:RNA polymerase sigma factor [Sedimentisphaerales bacterium]